MPSLNPQQSHKVASIIQMRGLLTEKSLQVQLVPMWWHGTWNYALHYYKRKRSGDKQKLVGRLYLLDNPTENEKGVFMEQLRKTLRWEWFGFISNADLLAVLPTAVNLCLYE